MSNMTAKEISAYYSEYHGLEWIIEQGNPETPYYDLEKYFSVEVLKMAGSQGVPKKIKNNFMRAAAAVVITHAKARREEIELLFKMEGISLEK